MSLKTSHLIHNRARRVRSARLTAAMTALLLWIGATVPPCAAAAPQPLLLAPADIALYLKVMHAAVERLRHPTAEDRAAAERADAAKQRQRRAYDAFATRHADGSRPAPEEMATLRASDPDEQERRAIAYTAILRRQPDILVARESGVDQRRYGRIREVIERLVPDADEDRDEDAKPAEAATPPRQATAQERLAREADARNSTALQPQADEIRELLRRLGRKRETD